MSVTNKLLKLRPFDHWVFNGTSFDNVIGDNSVTGTPTADITIDKNNSSSARFKSGTVGTVAVPIFDTGGATKAFGIGGQFMVCGTDDITLLGTGAGEGLTYTSGKYRFMTIQNGTDYAAEFAFENLGNAIIFGVHEPTANHLYINGTQVASVDIPEADQGQDFLSTSGTLLIGSTSGSASVLCDNLCVVYGTPRSSIMLEAYQEAPVSTSTAGDLDFGQDAGSIVLADSLPSEFILNPGSSFQNMFLNGVTVDSITNIGNVLTPVLNNTTTVAGQAYGVIPVGMESGTPIIMAGSSIKWNGSGTVEASIDGGVTYTTCSNGGAIPGVTSGVDMDNKDIIIRISFTGGGSYLSQYLYNLEAVAYTRTDVASQNIDTTVDSGTVMSDSKPNNDYSGSWGSGRIVVAEPGFTYTGVEMLVKLDDSTGTQTLFQVGDLVSPLYLGVFGGALDHAGITGASINGVYNAPPSHQVYDGEVMHIVALFTHKAGDIYLLADHNNANPFKGGLRVFNVYENMTQAQAESLYVTRLQQDLLVVTEDVSTVTFNHSAMTIAAFNSETVISVS